MTDKQWIEKEAAELSNEIIDRMTRKGLTLEILDTAVSNVEHMFRKNATVKKG